LRLVPTEADRHVQAAQAGLNEPLDDLRCQAAGLLRLLARRANRGTQRLRCPYWVTQCSHVLPPRYVYTLDLNPARMPEPVDGFERRTPGVRRGRKPERSGGWRPSLARRGSVRLGHTCRLPLP